MLHFTRRIFAEEHLSVLVLRSELWSSLDPPRVYRTLPKPVDTILLEDEGVKMKILI